MDRKKGTLFLIITAILSAMSGCGDLAMIPYDIVVVGGGPNGLGIACYLAKCGMSVCVCEDRMELGGGAENAEPMPGFRIDPQPQY